MTNHQARSLEEIRRTMELAREGINNPRPIPASVPIKVGVDLGTAYTVIMVTDEHDRPLAGASVFADVVRDGIVWDFAGAQQVLRELKEKLEASINRSLTRGAVTIPPDVAGSSHRAHKYVLEGAGIECDHVVDEPTAANAILGLSDGAVVDVGGGTTGIAIVRDGKVIKTIDEPTGGTHLSLVIAGAKGMSFADADKYKRTASNHKELYGIVLPVLQKIASIVARAIEGEDVKTIHLVGGTAGFTGFEKIMTDVTGVPSVVAPDPILVTPLGVASWSPTQIGDGR